MDSTIGTENKRKIEASWILLSIFYLLISVGIVGCAVFLHLAVKRGILLSGLFLLAAFGALIEGIAAYLIGAGILFLALVFIFTACIGGNVREKVIWLLSGWSLTLMFGTALAAGLKMYDAKNGFGASFGWTYPILIFVSFVAGFLCIRFYLHWFGPPKWKLQLIPSELGVLGVVILVLFYIGACTATRSEIRFTPHEPTTICYTGGMLSDEWRLRLDGEYIGVYESGDEVIELKKDGYGFYTHNGEKYTIVWRCRDGELVAETMSLFRGENNVNYYEISAKIEGDTMSANLKKALVPYAYTIFKKVG